jgi:hypothetical protein
MKTPERWLDKVAELRAQHSAAFHAQDWKKMQSIRNHILTAWEGYHRAVEQAKAATGVVERLLGQ